MKGSLIRKSDTTREQRLRALEMQEARQRDVLRSQYGQQRPPKSHMAKKQDPLKTNSYYTYFHAPTEDERVARKLLSDPVKAGVDLTSLKPESAKLYVKYEKVHAAMKAEDDEFVAFRKTFLEESRRIAVAGGFAVAVQQQQVASAPRVQSQVY